MFQQHVLYVFVKFACLEWGIFFVLLTYLQIQKGGKLMKGLVKGIGTTISAAALALFVSAQSASAHVKKAFTDAGIKDTGSIDGLYADLNSALGVVIMIGVIWCIFWLIVAALTLAGSNGNPQKRNVGISAIVFVIIGIFVLYKSYDIAGWATGLG